MIAQKLKLKQTDKSYGPYILTNSGSKFFTDPTYFKHNRYDIFDIAHALSNQCRWNGHCNEFYSVAEHSLRVSAACPPAHRLSGLLHDMTEAFISDVPTPVKLVLPSLKLYEEALYVSMAEQFGVPPLLPYWVEVADKVLLVTEARDLCGNPAWIKEERYAKIERLPEKIVPVSRTEAKAAFLNKYFELSKGEPNVT